MPFCWMLLQAKAFEDCQCLVNVYCSMKDLPAGLDHKPSIAILAKHPGPSDAIPCPNRFQLPLLRCLRTSS